MFRINGRPIKNNRNLLHGLSDVFGVSLSKAGQMRDFTKEIPELSTRSEKVQSNYLTEYYTH